MADEDDSKGAEGEGGEGTDSGAWRGVEGMVMVVVIVGSEGSVEVVFEAPWAASEGVQENEDASRASQMLSSGTGMRACAGKALWSAGLRRKGLSDDLLCIPISNPSLFTCLLNYYN